MKKAKNFVFSIWSLVTFVILGPVLVSGYSLFMALVNGYSMDRPLYSLAAIALVAFVSYYPMWRAKDMTEFDNSHEFESVHRLIFGGMAMAFIALFPEVEQVREFGYVNHVMLYLFNGWFAFFIGFWLIALLVFGLGLGRN